MCGIEAEPVSWREFPGRVSLLPPTALLAADEWGIRIASLHCWRSMRYGKRWWAPGLWVSLPFSKRAAGGHRWCWRLPLGGIMGRCRLMVPCGTC